MKLVIKLGRILMLAISLMACSEDDENILPEISEIPEETQPLPNPDENEADPHKILGLEPLNGTMNTEVFVKGENFGDDASSIKVYFNTMEAEIETINDQTIKVIVPVGAGTGTVKVVKNEVEVVGPEFTYVQTLAVSTVAGSTRGDTDGLGTAAMFNRPTGVALDANGNLFVADAINHRIRKITPDGAVTTYAGGEKGGVDGAALDAKFNAPWDVDVDAEGNVYVADSQNHKIRKISPDGVVTTWAGSDQGNFNAVGKDAQFDNPMGVAVTPDGVVYVADSNNDALRKIDKEQNVTKFPGGFGTLTGIDVDQDGYVYIVSFNSHSIWKIHYENREIQLMAGNNGEGDIDGSSGTAFNHPKDVAVDGQGNLYITDEGNNKIRMITPEGKVSTYAGGDLGAEDGPVATAQFKYPYGLAVTPEGIVYVADTVNDRIRKIAQG